MGSQHNYPAANYWGHLIRADKSATPLLEQLCLGIAKLISKIKQSNTDDLTPDKLAAFYRAVGGNYDTLFLSTPHASLSFIYQSLGCFHTLQPTSNAYEPPSVPALLPHGFVRWQTIQLLLCPDEHARFLQEAVEKYEIVNPSGGAIFPKILPREAFPAEPDPEMVQWHEKVSKRLEHDYHVRKSKKASSSRRSSPHAASHSRRASTTLEDAASGADDYFAAHHPGKRYPPNGASRPSSRESFPQFTRVHQRGMAEHFPPPQSHAELKRRQTEKNEKSFVFESRRDRSQSLSHHRQWSPVRPSARGRSTTSSVPGVRKLSPDSPSEESDDAEVEPSPEIVEEIVDEEELPSARPNMLNPAIRHHARRHSHDASYASRRRWNNSPPQGIPDGGERSASPGSRHGRDFHYPHAPPFRRSKSRPSSHYYERYEPDPDPPMRSSLVRKKTKPPAPAVRFREYIFDDPDYTNSAPPSPNSNPRSHRLHRQRDGDGHPSSRHYLPRLEPDLGPPLYDARRRSSVNGGSRSGSSQEGTRPMSVGGKLGPSSRYEVLPHPAMLRRYVTPPSSLNGGVPIDVDMSDERRAGRRPR